MADKETRIRIVGVDQASTVFRDVMKSAAGFLVRDVVIGSWNQLSGAIRGLSSELVNANSEWEGFSTRLFAQLGHDADETAARLEYLKDFALKTPFDMPGIIEADLLMRNLGLQAVNASERWGYSGDEILRVTGDIAAGTKQPFEEIGMWLGRFSTGDTGLAIRRFEQLGITTRAELKRMGLEFSKAGEMVSPIDEAFSTLVKLTDEKFGGLMAIQSKTLDGVKANLGEFIDNQKREWGQPIFEGYKASMAGLLTFLQSDAVGNLLGIGRDMFAAATGWLGDVVSEWAGWFGTLAADAANWGANIVDQFASGIAGSGAVSSALRDFGKEITNWLAPGSPPKLLPELTDWGLGAAEAWLDGWAGATPAIEPAMLNIGKELAPFLEQIDAGGGVSGRQLRTQLGPKGLGYEAYLSSYKRVKEAVAGVAEAKGALTEAEETGDAEAVDAAKQKLTLAEKEEKTAKDAMALEQKRIASRVTAESQMLEAIRAQTAAVQAKDKAETDAAAKAAARAAEAEQKAREQAYLQYRLTVAGTASGQIPIWEEELAKAEQGSAEFWNIQARLVELRRKEAESQGEDIGGAFMEGYAKTALIEGGGEGEEAGGFGNLGAVFAAAGKGLGKQLLDGLVAEAKSLPKRLLDWSTELLGWVHADDTRLRWQLGGYNLGKSLGDGLAALFGFDSTSQEFGDSVVGMITRAIGNIGQALWDLGATAAQEFFLGLTESLTGTTPEETKRLTEAYYPWKMPTGETATTGQQYGVAQAPYGPFPAPGRVPGQALGTTSAPGGWSLVGERGPELVNLPAGSQVMNAGDTRKAMGGTTVNVAPGAIVIHVANGNAREVQTGVVRALRQIGVPA
ncbi:MAG: hypothetical protein WC683_12625 [bacterium]